MSGRLTQVQFLPHHQKEPGEQSSRTRADQISNHIGHFTMTQPLRESDILFPHQSNTPSLSTTLSTLRRSTLSLHNRLSSITSDNSFVESVASAYDLPLIANERCGSWYISPSQKAGSVYFKSTDGHMGQWKFNLRRLNLQLLDVVAERGGAVIVDSTRRGKSMPDALSKTVPIWCAVINRAVFGEAGDEGRLHVPPSVVGESERFQMEGRIGGFVKQFVEICKPHIPTLRAKLTKPLRPIWITQASSHPSTPPSFPEFHPIVLCTASRRVQGAEISENGYIQGAADDHEAWAHGLTPQLFWKNKDLLMNTPEDDAPSIIKKLIADEKCGNVTATLIQPTKNVYISSNEGTDTTDFDAIIECTPKSLLINDPKERGTKHHLHLKCQTGKLGSRDLRTQLPRLLEFLNSLPSLSASRILVCCPTGKDLSVGTALAILCLAADEQGNMDGKLSTEGITKDFIKQRLSWITTSNPALNPSRATLQSVNAILFDTQIPNPRIHHQPSPTTTNPPSRYNPTTQDSVPLPREETPTSDPKKTEDPTPRLSSPQEQIFKSLYSSAQPWTFSRTLSSQLPSHPSGTVIGTATFTPCATTASPFTSTSPSTTAPATPTALLHAEQGAFTLANGLKFDVKRRYIYLLNSPNNTSEKYIAVYFCDEDTSPSNPTNPSTPSDPDKTPSTNIVNTGALFVEIDTLHRLDFDPNINTNTNTPLWTAKNKIQHLCAEDVYTAEWRFSDTMAGGEGEGEGGQQEGIAGEAQAQAQGQGQEWWEVRYDVQGPRKAYTSVTRYVRV
ncbi:hypothetical protein J1614_005393 [Plenodomus biglobosus]|nr:hypothetical protein J1614_005393 [Plenodomus biglobosus]